MKNIINKPNKSDLFQVAKAAGITPKTLAETCGVSVSAIYKVLHGETKSKRLEKAILNSIRTGLRHAQSALRRKAA